MKATNLLAKAPDANGVRALVKQILGPERVADMQKRARRSPAEILAEQRRQEEAQQRLRAVAEKYRIEALAMTTLCDLVGEEVVSKALADIENEGGAA